MSSCVRYQNEEIRQHLASQYVLGLLTRRVAKRCEALMRNDPEFEKAVYDWQQRMNSMNSNLAPVAVPKKVWQGIEQQLDGSQPTPESHFNIFSWLSNIFVLRTALAGVLCFVLVVLFMPETQQPPVTASYIALMSANENNAEPNLVVSAYQGAEPGQSNLRFQWNERGETTPIAQLGIIAIERETGNATFIGTITDPKQPLYLDKLAWQAVKNSAELLIVQGETAQAPIIFRGPCIQLDQWI